MQINNALDELPKQRSGWGHFECNRVTVANARMGKTCASMTAQASNIARFTGALMNSRRVFLKDASFAATAALTTNPLFMWATSQRASADAGQRALCFGVQHCCLSLSLSRVNERHRDLYETVVATCP